MPPKLRLSFGQKTPAVQGVFPTFKRYKQVPRQRTLDDRCDRRGGRCSQ